MDDEKYMREALREALKAYAAGEVPVGAVVVRDGEIIGRGHNTRETKNDPAGHAEMSAIREAAVFTGSWRLENCDIYVTLEPCMMCAGAIYLSRLRKVIYGAADPKAGVVETRARLLEADWLNHHPDTGGGMMAATCSALLSRFFRKLRSRDRSLNG